MITQTLGARGLEVSAIGLGCMSLMHAYGLDIAEQDGMDLIRAGRRIRFALGRWSSARRSCRPRRVVAG